MTGSIEAHQYLAALTTMRPRDLDGERLGMSLLSEADDMLRTRRSLSMRGVDGAPDWLAYETALWQISERMRPLLAARKDLHGTGPIMAAIQALCSRKEFGKGRQNFVLMLGDFGGPSAVEILGTLLGDPEVEGHALKALYKLRAFRFVDEANAIVSRSSGWVRTAATKYLKAAQAGQDN